MASSGQKYHLRSQRTQEGLAVARIMDPRLVILSRGPQLYSTKRIADEAEKAGWAVKILDPLKLSLIHI